MPSIQTVKVEVKRRSEEVTLWGKKISTKALFGNFKCALGIVRNK